MSETAFEDTSDERGPRRVEIYDTTLRDGSQMEGLSLTVGDKLRIAHELDELGVSYVEGGWPGANPKDDEFFARAHTELELTNAQLVAFGSTRRAGGTTDSDQALANLVAGETDVVCIVGKTWDYHVTEALRTSLAEGIDMIGDSVVWLVDQGKTVFFDAEHFFDGFKANSSYALDALDAASQAGARRLVLCDTNGGTLPSEVAGVVARASDRFPDSIGVHFHNDSGCAVANALVSVDNGAVQVQGCMNGLGERTGNANLTSIIPNLQMKMGYHCIDADRLKRLTGVSHAIAEIANVSLDSHQPFIGSSAFAHKAGLHVSALARRPDAYEHVDPNLVGNGTRLVVSELAGRATVAIKAAEVGVDLNDRPDTIAEILDEIKELEHAGYQFEAADGSFELLVRRAAGEAPEFFRLESFRVIADKRADGEVATEATIKLHAGGNRYIATAEGNGPVNAMDKALRSCIERHYPALEDIHLTDYKVRVLDTEKGTGAVTRVLIDTTDGHTAWGTIGVSENIIEASWQALAESIVVGLLRSQRR